jgi:uncharacterized membrane protein YgcG
MEVLSLQRSYWVPLTVAMVFKPDYGSVFARALQRGIGTVVGAAAGAALLVLVHGAWLLIPFGVLAALLPYGRSRNYGLLSTFLTPLVVVLVDLLSPRGWHLAGDRLIDTLIGCAIVLVVGFAPWPMSWYSHLPRQYAQAALDVCRYLAEALRPAADPGSGDGADAGSGAGSGVGSGGRSGVGSGDRSGVGSGGPSGADGPSRRSRMQRSTYRALADLRAEFQRTMSEPPSISRPAAAWWPAVVGLEQVMDAITAVALAVGCGTGAPQPGVSRSAVSPSGVSRSGVSPTGVSPTGVSPTGVGQLCGALRKISEAAATGTALAKEPKLPDDDTLKPVTEAVRELLGVFGTGRRLTATG